MNHQNRYLVLFIVFPNLSAGAQWKKVQEEFARTPITRARKAFHFYILF